MENNTAAVSSPLSSEAKPATTTTNKKSVKKPKKTKTTKSAKAKKAPRALFNTLKLSDTTQERLDRFRKYLKRGVATRSELKAANKKLFRKKSSPAYITKNEAFKTTVPGLYSLVAQKGTAATAAAVKAYLASKSQTSNR